MEMYLELPRIYLFTNKDRFKISGYIRQEKDFHISNNLLAVILTSVRFITHVFLIPLLGIGKMRSYPAL